MIPNFLTMRNAQEQIRRLLRIVDEAPPADSERLQMPTAVNLVDVPLRAQNYKRAEGWRDVSKINLMVGHVTDVTGGFGVQKWGPDGWRTWLHKLHREEVPMSILVDLRREFGKLPDEELAKLLALCSRLRQLVYHRITSRVLGECINRPFGRRTWASSALNDGIAMAVDCGHKEPITGDFAEASINMVIRAYYDLRDDGVTGKILYAVHGQGSRHRWNDTYRIAHLAIYKPAILRLQDQGEDVEVGYEVAVGGGRPLTTRDDPEAHFDTRGRRVRRSDGSPL